MVIDPEPIDKKRARASCSASFCYRTTDLAGGFLFHRCFFLSRGTWRLLYLYGRTANRRLGTTAGAATGAAQPSHKALNLPTGIDDTLRPREERVAVRTYLDLQLRLHGSGFKRVATSANHD
jgi:hypothetical protein